jgi:small subunit ribosomal protein S1
VLEVDTEKRRLRLGMKQLVPTSIDEYLAEQKAGNVVSGRVIAISGESARVELGQGIEGLCLISAAKAVPAKTEDATTANADLASLSSMLKARWKGGASSGAAKPEALAAGQIRSFRITKLDPSTKKIELELV